MITEIETAPIQKLTIEGADVYLEDLGPNAGKVTLTMDSGESYYYVWYAMNGTLGDFLQWINAEYFARNLVPAISHRVLDVPATFMAVRRHIRDEFQLRGYQHMDFQKQMREVLRAFQEEIQERMNEVAFVDRFKPAFLDRLDFSLIKEHSDRVIVERNFTEYFTEQWGFIAQMDSPSMLAVKRAHGKLVTLLKSETTCPPTK